MGRQRQGREEMKVTVTIPKTQEAKEDGKPFTFYMLHIDCDLLGPDEITPVVPRRFRDFEALRNDLLLEFPEIFDPKQNPDAPTLPAKQVLGGARVLEAGQIFAAR